MTNDSMSPAAQEVLDAFTEDNSLHDWKHNHYNVDALAAALRAAADQVVPENRFGPPENAAAVQREITRAGILAIAAELKTSTTENR